MLADQLPQLLDHAVPAEEQLLVVRLVPGEAPVARRRLLGLLARRARQLRVYLTGPRPSASMIWINDLLKATV
ncbi:hypothetical protein OHU10_04620 [Streptomyces europaeiscabiei]